MDAKKTPVQRPAISKVVTAVGIWWLANTIATIASKSYMRGGDGRTKTHSGVTAAFQDLRWVELTTLQHLVGAVLATVWVKVSGKPLLPGHAREHTLLVCVAAVGNVVGNSATNAAYSLITSSTAQVIKACEPLFTFVLTLLLYRNYSNLDISTLLSVVIVVIGAGAFLMGDATFNIWGLVAAMIANMAFPTRNIFLKKLSDIWDNPLQKFAVMSILSTLFVTPFWILRVLFVSGLSAEHLADSLVSSFFHSTYNLASITVLESVNPVTHAILNISKRLFVIIANILYFNVPFTMIMFVSLMVLLIGCYLYQLKNSSTSKWVVMKCVLITAFLVYLFLPIPGIHGPESSSYNLYTAQPSVVPSRVSYSSEIDNNCVQSRISTAWVYDRPIPSNIVSNIKALSQTNPDLPVFVYCGTTQCVNAIANLNNSRVHAEFAVVKEIVKGMPLEQWLARHAFNKILARKSFENHLQDAVRLGLLWKYGGFYVSPTVKITEKLNISTSCLGGMGAWVSGGVSVTDNPRDYLAAASFTRHHPFIDRLARSFVKEYPMRGSDKTPFKFDFKSSVAKLLSNKSCSVCPSVTTLLQLASVKPESTGEPNHFGTLSFQSRVSGISVANLGDEIQDFPGLEYVPFIDHFVERDNLWSARGSDHTLTFFNAWWGGGGSSWPAPSNIEPIMLSVHLHGSSLSSKVTRNLDFVKKRQPIGCRDPTTLSLMHKYDIKAFFSGCMTLLISNPTIGGERNDKIYLVDVKQVYVDMLPPEIQKNAIRIEHNLKGSTRLDSLNRFSKGYELMKKYGQAKLVVTQRIHCGLPCVAMDTPVLFFNGAGMPGGGGSSKSSSTRIAGLTPLFHSVDFYNMNKTTAKKWLADFDWNNPPPNPNVALTMRLRAAFWDVIRRYPSLRDAGRKFGAIPMSPPVPPPGIKKFLFHVIFTSEMAKGDKLHWRYWRSIESIFHHHPTSEVIVHSNTLPQDTFDVLSESAYAITVQRYDLKEMLQGSPAEKLRSRVGDTEVSSRRKADLVGLLVVYKLGGVLVDLDTIFVRPIDMLAGNTLVWLDSTNTSINSNFMIFEKGHSYIQSCLSEFAEHYNDDTSTGRDILTKVWLHTDKGSTDVHVVSYQTMYELVSGDMIQTCLESTSGEAFDASKKVADTKAYGVGLNSEMWSTSQAGVNVMKSGTLCSHLLNSFCVLCDNLH